MQVATPTQDKASGSSFGPSRHLSIALLGMALLVLVILIGSNGPAVAGQGSPARDLFWQIMRGLNFRTGEMTPELGAFIDAEARVPGYMVPLEDNLDEVTEFLLVPYPGACIHVPPPPPNQIIHVTMEKVKTTAVRPL
jgi:uncharacterized protein